MGRAKVVAKRAREAVAAADGAAGADADLAFGERFAAKILAGLEQQVPEPGARRAALAPAFASAREACRSSRVASSTER